MRKRTISKNLKHVLLEGGAFSRALFELDLESRIAEYLASKHEDHDEYLFVITEEANEIAMMLIDENDTVHVNEDARALLMKLWQGEVYQSNVRLFMRDMVSELDKGNLYFMGVKVAERGRKRAWLPFPRLFS